MEIEKEKRKNRGYFKKSLTDAPLDLGAFGVGGKHSLTVNGGS